MDSSLKYQFLVLTTALIFSNFAFAQNDVDTDLTQIGCDSQSIQFERHVEGIKVISTKTAQETELMCMGQCSIDEWACVFVDGVAYLWFRGSNAIRYSVGPIEGHEYIGHWAIQLNEIDFGERLKHEHINDIPKYFQLLDKTQDEHLIYNPDFDYKETIKRSKYSKLARKKYPYLNQVYESAIFSRE